MAKVSIAPNYNLILSKDEAQALLDLLYCVGGDPDKSRRKFTAAIADALESLGLVGADCDSLGYDMEGSVYFKDQR